MAIPTSRETFKQFCLRQLGAPVIQINVDDTQVDDAVDIALEKFRQYHFSGSEKTFYKYQVQDADKIDQQITLPDYIIDVIGLFPISSIINPSNFFDARYQFVLNDLWSVSSNSIIPYYMAMQNIQFLEQILVGNQPIRFTYSTGILHIDMDWNRIATGEYIVVECFQAIDATTNTKMWNDLWLKAYSTALIKKQWGNNLKKFEGIVLPGGLVYNGQKTYDEAVAELAQLEDDLLNKYSFPPQMIVQ